jgi:tRNA (guanine37-N1)-methyltransferase
MPLPKGGENFLEEAMLCLKPSGGFIHFYNFVDRDDPYSDSIEKINKVAEKLNKDVEIVFKREVRDYSPDTVQIVIDFFVKDK